MLNKMDNKLKARFFGMHIGCDVEFRINNLTQVFKRRLCGVNTEFNAFFVSDFSEEVSYRVSFLENPRLVLRSLSSITDEEVATFLQHDRPIANWSLPERDEDGIIVRSIDGVSQWHYQIPYKWPGKEMIYTLEQSDYLRSIGICLPFMGLDPVAENWAILETVNQPTGANQ